MLRELSLQRWVTSTYSDEIVVPEKLQEGKPWALPSLTDGWEGGGGRQTSLSEFEASQPVAGSRPVRAILTFFLSVSM